MPSSSPLPSPDDHAALVSPEVVSQLGALLPRLLRAVERRVHIEFPHPVLPEGQLALVRLVKERPGVTVREAADELLMKPNNVSAMVSQLAGQGQLERVTDPADRRIVHLHTTEEADRRFAIAEALTSTVLGDGLNALSADEVAAIGQALPALTALLRQVHPATG
ncbi:MarR family transcriptional regulator [Microtetraspora sp. AC03309]|uniref:MarR family winged helix-turn-helix transcriptional regulator n=1 Tax=Microtetraspora sp. AC03309 TaxID=2779376 RepID=UPI001E60DD18|nr:MarR family transcriptional regulator [Microtetraspora sp. AC03309]MCC5579488.1 MarR family transcriptional regulator [Microtetraspora sp. AC03309]